MPSNPKSVQLLDIRNIRECFILSVAIILFVTAAAKLLGATSSAHILASFDPMLFLSNREVFRLAAVMELSVSAYLLMGRNHNMKLVLIAGLSAFYLIYRVGLQLVAAPNLFSCLGNLTGLIPISPRILDRLTVAMLGWMLIGSYTLLTVEWFGYYRNARMKRGSGIPEAVPTTNA
jgi:hypothetical protein